MNFVPSMPEHWVLAQWIVATIAAFCIGLSKTGFNGVGPVFALMMALIMPARASTGFVLPMLLFADFFAVRTFHRHANWTHIRGLIPPAFLGIAVGFYAMSHLSDALYRPVIGWLVMFICALQLLRTKRESWFANLPQNKIFGGAMGTSAGITTMMANGSGPVATFYFLVSGLPKMEFVGTGAWFFFFMNLFKTPFSIKMGLINFDSLRWNAVLLPAVLLGICVGKWLLARVSQKSFEQLLLAFSFLAAIKLIFS